MVPKEISSLQHSLVKKAVELRQQRKAREENGQLLLAGKKIIGDLAKTFAIDQIFYTDAPPPFFSNEQIRVTPEILKKITGLEEPDGLAAIIALPKPRSLVDQRRLLILDEIQDPGNLGALWRTALALGWDGLWLTPGCVDPFNDKALRAAQGATFHLPYEWILPEAILEWTRSHQANLLAADLKGTPLDLCQAALPLALILGNEGRGIGAWAKTSAKRITIPIHSATDSLNVASAGAILLYALRPR